MAQNQAFQQLKKQMAEDVILAIPTETDPFRVEADASEGAVGAVLSQQQKGVWQPVAFMSKVLHPVLPPDAKRPVSRQLINYQKSCLETSALRTIVLSPFWHPSVLRHPVHLFGMIAGRNPNRKLVHFSNTATPKWLAQCQPDILLNLAPSRSLLGWAKNLMT